MLKFWIPQTSGFNNILKPSLIEPGHVTGLDHIKAWHKKLTRFDLIEYLVEQVDLVRSKWINLRIMYNIHFLFFLILCFA